MTSPTDPGGKALAAIFGGLRERLAQEQAELLKRDLVIQNLWARADELVAERNAMTAHINLLAEDWQAALDQLEAAQQRIDAATKLHTKRTDGEGDFCLTCMGLDNWPCATAAALGAAVNDSSTEATQ